MKDRFIMCLSPITAAVTLAMAVAVAVNAYFCGTKVVEGFDWKVGVYVLVEVVAAVIVVLMAKEVPPIRWNLQALTKTMCLNIRILKKFKPAEIPKQA